MAASRERDAQCYRMVNLRHIKKETLLILRNFMPNIAILTILFNKILYPKSKVWDIPQFMSDEIFLLFIQIHSVKDIRKDVPNFEGCNPPPTPPTTLQCQTSEFSAIQKNATFAS